MACRQPDVRVLGRSALDPRDGAAIEETDRGGDCRRSRGRGRARHEVAHWQARSKGLSGDPHRVGGVGLQMRAQVEAQRPIQRTVAVAP